MKKIILLISILVVVAAGICWTSMRPAKAIPINGTLLAKDIADIRQVVKKDLRRKILPNLSWRSFKGLTANAKNYFKYEILEINAATNSTETIAVVRLPGSKTPVEFVALYQMSKAKISDRWRLVMMLQRIPRNTEKQLEALLLQMPRPPIYSAALPRPLFAPAPPPPNPVPPFQPVPSSADFVRASNRLLINAITAQQQMEMINAQRSRALTNSPLAPLPVAVPIAPETNATNGGAP